MRSIHTSAPAISGSAEPELRTESLSDSIAKRAYFLYLTSAALHGHDLDHWLLAEKLTNAERRRRKL